MRALIVGLLMLWSSIGNAQRDTESGNYFLLTCPERRSAPERNYSRGICVGMMSALLRVASSLEEESRFCPPKDATAGQAFAIARRYIETKPDRARENFVDLAVEALRSEWPCKQQD
jgi:Ssp1 endopeptidase immunity protein Rap1a